MFLIHLAESENPISNFVSFLGPVVYHLFTNSNIFLLGLTVTVYGVKQETF